MSEPQERYYNIAKLNKVFAISSLVLLGTIGWMLLDDYARRWKGYQREFRSYEVEKTRVKFDKEKNLLKDQERYQELLVEREAAQAAYDANSAGLVDLRTELEAVQGENDLLVQQYRFTKAELDAAKYQYEEAKNHNSSNLDRAEEAFDVLQAQEKQQKLAVEVSDQEVQQKRDAFDALGVHLKEIEREQGLFAQEKTLLENKLEKIDQHAMTLPNLVADLVRDLPLIDMASPNYKIRQVVLKDLKDDLNFMQVPKVERCITCHLGIDNLDYKDLPQPFRTHSNLEQYVDKDSPHPLEDFGCTSCHGGRGRGTDFVTAAHTPSSDEQKKEWEEQYNWEAFHHWDTPMVPLQYTESGCFKCHSGETVIAGAENLNLGLQLMERAGCYTCHEIDKYEGWVQPGPNLKAIATKVTPEWARRWIADPHSFRHNTWMPAFWGQSNNSDPNSQARADQEVRSIAHYLFAASKEIELTDIPVPGDPVRGEELVASVGCFGCHKIEPDPVVTPATRQNLQREQGPNLIGLGSKTSATWVFNWLKDPHRFRADTRMPNLRLTDQEAADIAAYLTQSDISKRDDFDRKPLAPIDEAIVDTLVTEFLTRTMTRAQADEQRAGMALDDKLEYAGQKLIAHYGCFSCHAIEGFDDMKPIGTALTQEGSKSIHNLDFGFIHIDHSRQAWFKQKLKEPRIFDENRVKTPGEKLRMPNFNFTDEEADALVTALLGFTKAKPGHLKLTGASVEEQYIQEGQRVVRQFNCQGCHELEGEGGAIQPKVFDWLVKYQDKEENEADAVFKSFSPPNLIGEGKKVHAQWLFDFLHAPSTIRPWLKTRMPTFNFTAAQSNALVRYFSALDRVDFPFAEMVSDAEIARDYEDGKKLFSEEYLACGKCHIVGDQTPGGSADSWAPDFTLARNRLKPQWMIDWLMDPQALLPGTKMPGYFEAEYFDDAGPEDILGGDETLQIKALRNFILGLGAEKGKTESSARSDDRPDPKQTVVGGRVSRAFTVPGD